MMNLTPTCALYEARLHFRDLLNDPTSKERDFQALFSECPSILARGLPLRLRTTDIRPMGTPGQSVPDFVFYPSLPRVNDYWGVVELKHPRSRIFKKPRKRVVTLSDSATTAVGQAKRYLQDLELGHLGHLFQPPSYNMMLGTPWFAFIVTGLSTEIAAAFAQDLSEGELNSLLPGNFRLVPYDTLFDRFSSSIPPRIMVLHALQHKRRWFIMQFSARSRSERFIDVEKLVQWFASNGSPDVFIEKMDDYTSFDASRIQLGRNHEDLDDLLEELWAFMSRNGIHSRIGQTLELSDRGTR